MVYQKTCPTKNQTNKTAKCTTQGPDSIRAQEAQLLDTACGRKHNK